MHGTAALEAETPRQREGQRDRAAGGGGRGGKRKQAVLVDPSVAATRNDLEIAFFLQFKIFQIRI